MKLLKAICVFLCAALVCVALCPRASADEWNKKIIITIDQPLEVPHHVLDPGTYVFKLADNSSYRHIVQIWTGDETHLITTTFTVPICRDDVTDYPDLWLDERPADVPQAIHAWFYPGDHNGEQFTYPRWEYRPYAASYNTTR